MTQADVQAQIVRRVEELVAPTQAELLPTDGPAIANIVRRTMALVAEHTIDIPRILVKPRGAMQTGYKPFVLGVSKINFQPQGQQLVSRGLQTGKDVLYGQSSTIGEARVEDYIVRELIGFDDVSYDEHAGLIYGLAGQAVAHFNAYLKTDAELHNVRANHGKTIAENVMRRWRSSTSKTSASARWLCTEEGDGHRHRRCESKSQGGRGLNATLDALTTRSGLTNVKTRG